MKKDYLFVIHCPITEFNSLLQLPSNLPFLQYIHDTTNPRNVM